MWGPQAGPAVPGRQQQAAQCKHLCRASNLHLIQTLQQQAWHQSAFPSQGLWIYSESYTLAMLQQSALGCRGCAGVHEAQGTVRH